MDLTIEHQAQEIDYEKFRCLNDLCFPDEPVSEHEYQEFISAEFWVAFHHENPVGYAVMTSGEKKAHIRRICTHPDFRSQGIASKLMGKMLSKARLTNAHLVDLLVRQDNQPAINLYRRYGFQIAGESVQFSTPITPTMVGDFSIVSIDEYQNSKDYYPQEQRILDWAHHHNPPHKMVLVFLKGDIPVGFARFSPDFPGCSPFELFTGQRVDDVHVLVSLLDRFALPNKRTIKITTDNSNAIALFKSTGTHENYGLYRMIKIFA